MTHILPSIYGATWLWLPFLVLFLVQGLHCSPSVKLVLFKIALYYIVAAIGLQLLVPTTHLTLRIMLFDLTTRVFLFIQGAEIVWNSWNVGPALVIQGGSLKQKKLLDDDEDEDSGQPRVHRRGLTTHRKLLIFYIVSALLYLGWTVLGLTFAFTLTPGM